MKSSSALEKCVGIDHVELMHYCSMLIDTEAREITHDELRILVRKKLRPMLLPAIRAALNDVPLEESALIAQAVAHVERMASDYVDWNLRDTVEPLVTRRVNTAIKDVLDGFKVVPKRRKI
jgi:hypothetical protein